ncbi:DUF2190 family protein [Paracoccus yeei]|uniref:DUF2190 family protein n=1 Tax=Paracoccus yeei TaxID=147645 RepID=UPI0017489F33|nr:capsid cement protein [Paracoccus yeei]
MKNYIQPGDTITIPAPAALTSGQGVRVNALFGVAASNAAINEPVAISVSGVFELPKTTAALALGVAVEWNGTAIVALTSGIQIGTVVAAAAAGTATAKVLLR